MRGDGAANITSTAKQFPKSRRLLDTYHGLCKYTERLKEAFKGMPARKRRAIDDALSALHRAGDVDALLAEIEALKSHPALVSAEPLDKLAAWVKRHRDHLWYDEARQFGLGVGTGIAEKDVDLLLDRRYELRGMSWTPAGVQRNLRIRLALFNDQPAAIEAVVRQRAEAAR